MASGHLGNKKNELEKTASGCCLSSCACVDPYMVCVYAKEYLPCMLDRIPAYKCFSLLFCTLIPGCVWQLVWDFSVVLRAHL